MIEKEKNNAFALALALLESPCIKKDTVIGIIGNTQGITTAANPATKASQKNIHKDSSFCVSDACRSPDGTSAVFSTTFPAPFKGIVNSSSNMTHCPS